MSTTTTRCGARRGAGGGRRLAQDSSESHFFRGYENLFLAEDGRLVIRTNVHGLAGAVVDRATGCYALLTDRNRPSSLSYVGMFGDSVVTLEGRQSAMGIVDGKPRRVSTSTRTHIFVRPVRPVSGEPCSPSGAAASARAISGG